MSQITRWLLAFCLLVMASGTLEATPKNLLYITLDGVGQDTFFQLLRKNELPAIAQVIERGNIRTMSMGGVMSDHVQSYQALWTGRVSEEHQIVLPGSTVFEWVAKRFPEMRLVVIPSRIAVHGHRPLSLIARHLKETPITVLPDSARNSQKTAQEIILQFKNESDSPMFVAANFTAADLAGHNYRADGEEYSYAITSIDKALGRLFKHLKKSGQWEKTDIVIVPSHAFNRKHKQHNNKRDIWIASTDKIYRKGRLVDIVPSLKARFLGESSFGATPSLFHP